MWCWESRAKATTMTELTSITQKLLQSQIPTWFPNLNEGFYAYPCSIVYYTVLDAIILFICWPTKQIHGAFLRDYVHCTIF